MDALTLASENEIVAENENPNQQNNNESENFATNIDKNFSNILNNEELEGSPMVPPHIHDQNEREVNIDRRFQKIYSRKDVLQGKESEASLHSHESELELDWDSSDNFDSNSDSNSNSPIVPNELNLSIAVRKGIRTCTKYPMSKYVSYTNLSPSFSAFYSFSCGDSNNCAGCSTSSRVEGSRVRRDAGTWQE